MLVCICGRQSWRTGVPAELAMALLLVFSIPLAYIILDAAVPLPKEGMRLLITGVRADVRGDLVRGLAYVPILLGTWWLFVSMNSRRRSVKLFFAIVGFIATTHLVEALLILVLSPGALTGSSVAFRWDSKDAYAAAHLNAWATAITLILAWVLWRYRKAARMNAAA